MKRRHCQVKPGRRLGQRLLLAALALVLAAFVACGKKNVTGNEEEAPAALILPAGWEGHWDMTLTFTRCVDDDLKSVEEITGVFCPGDTITLEGSHLFTDCTQTRVGDSVAISCSDQYAFGGATVNVTFHMDVKRNGSALSGSGQWSAQKSGIMDPDLQDVCESVTLQGSRTGPIASDCD